MCEISNWSMKSKAGVYLPVHQVTKEKENSWSASCVCCLFTVYWSFPTLTNEIKFNPVDKKKNISFTFSYLYISPSLPVSLCLLLSVNRLTVCSLACSFTAMKKPILLSVWRRLGCRKEHWTEKGLIFFSPQWLTAIAGSSLRNYSFII